ncbi:MAG: tetratricopeptide repeat protein [Myxococcota bacterium]|jgi:tetratricopeptide (TPR) repeat protein|nr:tetratricopeptide repeat protein [Myxococcota bacterium]
MTLALQLGKRCTPRRHCLLAMALAVSLLSFSAKAESVSSLFDRANNAFWNGDYAGARDSYARLAQLSGPRPEVLYNLGTAYARLGNLGQAVLMYEKVLRLSPDNEDARHNLLVLREHLARRANEADRDADLAPSVTAFRALIDRFTTNGAALTFLTFELLLIAFLLVRRIVRADLPRLTLGVLSGVLALLSAAMLVLLLGRLHLETSVQEAIIVQAGQSDVFEGPGSEIRRFGLEEGSRVEVIGEMDGWRRLRDAEGRDGWVRAAELVDI